MDFHFTKQQLEFQQEVEDFIKKNVPPGYSEKSLYWPGGYGAILEFEVRDPAVDKFREVMSKDGWMTMAWPKELGGGGRSAIDQAIFAERLKKPTASAARFPNGGLANTKSACWIGSVRKFDRIMSERLGSRS